MSGRRGHEGPGPGVTCPWPRTAGLGDDVPGSKAWILNRKEVGGERENCGKQRRKGGGCVYVCMYVCVVCECVGGCGGGSVCSECAQVGVSLCVCVYVWPHSGLSAGSPIIKVHFECRSHQCGAQLSHTACRVSHSPSERRRGGRAGTESPLASLLRPSPRRPPTPTPALPAVLEVALLEGESDRLQDNANVLPGRGDGDTQASRAPSEALWRCCARRGQ